MKGKVYRLLSLEFGTPLSPAESFGERVQDTQKHHNAKLVQRQDICGVMQDRNGDLGSSTHRPIFTLATRFLHR